MKAKTLTPAQQFKLDIENVRLKHASKHTGQKYKVAMKELVSLERHYEDMLGAKGRISTYSITPKKSKGGEAVAVAVASDWHVDEIVTREATNGTNEYNMSIAKSRAEKFFRNTLVLVNKERQGVSIDTLVLALLGDFISAHIHPELMEVTEVSPQDAMIFAMNLIASGIEFLLENSDLNIVIPCSVGNHARDTDKVRIATEHGNNKEWAMYNFLALYFKNKTRVKFILPRSQFTYVKVYDHVLRFMHGHLGYRFNGGIGGVTIPLNKAVMRWNESQKADLTVLGHWHQRLDNGNWVINGSLIGDAPYGKVMGFSGKPEQTFFLWDKEHKKTVVAPVFVE